MSVSNGKHKYDYEIVNGEGLIPPGTEIVRTSVFRGNEELVKVVIPKSVASIDPLTFFGCTNLRSIEIDSSVVLLRYMGDRGVFSMSDYPPFPKLIDVVVNQGWAVNLFTSQSQDPYFWD